MTTTRLTMAQALVKFLDNQYIEVDGVQSKFVAGVFTIFGHGNVLGLGQALEQDSGDLVVHQGRNEQGMAHAAIGFQAAPAPQDLRVYGVRRPRRCQYADRRRDRHGQPYPVVAVARRCVRQPPA